MAGPILHQELLLGSRRNRLHLLRWVYAGWLVLQVLYCYLLFQKEELDRALLGDEVINRASAPAVVGEQFAEMFVRQQMVILVLLVPPFVAGAVSDEKRRGTLEYLLLSDLETRHIVLGKLIGRVAQVVLVLLAGLPLFGLLAGFGGVDPPSVLAVPAVLVLPVVALAAALLASVWCRQTRDAVLALYVVGLACGLVVWLVGGALRYVDPLYVLDPAWGPAQVRDLEEFGRRWLISSGAWGLLAGACLGLSIWRLRPVYVRELESVRPTGPTWYSVERVPVSDEPVPWREHYVEGLASNPTLRRVPQWLGITLVACVTVASSLLLLLVIDCCCCWCCCCCW
jgi:ABC-type transport system involved in multi-copper enzyme maturation permease subunit